MSDFILALNSTWADWFFWKSFFISLLRFFAGFGLSVIVAGILVLLSVNSKILERMIGLFISFFQPVPKIILFPLILVFVGLNDFSKILLVAAGLMFINFLILNKSVRLILTHPSMKIIKMFNVEPRKIVFYYYIKGLKDAFETISRNSIGYGLTLVIVSESNFANDGIGYLIWSFWERYELPALFVTIASIGLLAVLLNMMVTKVLNYFA